MDQNLALLGSFCIIKNQESMALIVFLKQILSLQCVGCVKVWSNLLLFQTIMVVKILVFSKLFRGCLSSDSVATICLQTVFRRYCNLILYLFKS